MRLFCYGTLQFPGIMQAVTGLQFSGVPAVLDDYACRVVRGEVYPGIVPAAGARTGGVVYNGIGTAHLVKLDRFEGDLYQRVRVCVSDRAGTPHLAWAYVIPEAMHRVLSRDAWNRETFEVTYLGDFLQSCRRFDRMSADSRQQADRRPDR